MATANTLAVQQPTGTSEFSWGPGQVPPGAEHAPPRDGGMYIGRSPDMADPLVGLAVVKLGATPAPSSPNERRRPATALST